MSSIPFVKASACGNDFLIIGAENAPADMAGFSRTICDRHHGVGADGVEWVLPASDADLAIRLINADGSEAEISGNGTRCVAAWFCAERGRDSVVIRTGAGLKTCELTARDGFRFEFRTSMGEAVISGESEVKLKNETVSGMVVSMGNPHFVVFVEEFPPGWQAWAAEIAVHPDFPQGTNVELAKVLDQHDIEVRFSERGVGETKSSGTGSSASAAASMHAGRAKSPVRVHARGGTQIVEGDRQLLLYGPTRLLCRGDIFI